MAEPATGPLAGVRVVDLTTEAGLYCGKLLADLGADSIKVEPPGGDAARGLAPFFHDEVGRETSLPYWYFNTNKRFVTCNLDHHDGQVLFKQLARSADVVVESFPPGYMDERGIGYEALRKDNPGLVYTTITGFGLDGPHRDWKSPDLVALAMSGLLTLAGDPMDPPNRMFGNQGYVSSSIGATEGTVMALFHKERTGEGQLVEVSMQEALAMAQETAQGFWDFQKTSRQRTGELTRLPGIGTYKTLDGYVFSMVGIPGFGAPWSVMLDWLVQEGMAEELASNPEYVSFLQTMDMRALTALMQDPAKLAEVQPMLDRIQAVVTAFYEARESMYLYETGQGRRLLIGIVATPKDLVESPHLNAREWFMTGEFRGEPVKYPGPPFRYSASPVTLRRTAVAPGAHNIEVWQGEAGIPADDLALYLAEGAL